MMDDEIAIISKRTVPWWVATEGTRKRFEGEIRTRNNVGA